MPAWLLPALMAGSSILGAIGGTRKPKTNAAVPKDLGPLRGQTLDLLRSLLSPGAFDAGGAGSNMFFGQPSDLQRSTRTGIGEFLRQPAPETRAFDASFPALQQMLNGGGPQFEHDISMANSQGGRFGSSNAVLRGEALRHMFNGRTQAAQTLGMLGQSAGQGPWERMMGGAAFADQDSTRRAQLLSGLLGLAAGGTMGLPVTQQPNAMSALGSAGMDLSQLLMLLPMLRSGMGGGGAGGAAGGSGAPRGTGVSDLWGALG